MTSYDYDFLYRFVPSTLNAFGFGSAYGEVKKFELCSAIDLHQKRLKDSIVKLPVVKYAADNVDHNLRTLDGKNTFHGMAIISIHDPIQETPSKIPRIKASLKDLEDVGKVDIIPYFKQITPTTSLVYQKLNKNDFRDSYRELDLLWKTSWSEDTTRPLWSGMMQLVQHGLYPKKAKVNFLPIIDMNPNDLTCIFSTLNFICKDAERYDAIPSVTFDQPLWWKARIIKENEPTNSAIKRMVLCLGGFHFKMSYLGAIGHIMSGSGLDTALSQVYAENSVIHMMSGKAYARAIRGHFMIDSALNSILLDDILKEDELSVKIGMLQY